MNKYKVTSPYVSILSGTLSLSDEQAAARAHCVSRRNDGFYNVAGPTGFKRGEIFGFDGDCSRMMLTMLEQVADDAEKEKKQKKEKK